MKKVHRHIIILLLMCTTVTLLFVTLGLVKVPDFSSESVTEEEAPVTADTVAGKSRMKDDSGFALTISGATWGGNCNVYFKRLKKSYSTMSAAEMRQRNLEIPDDIARNNVRATVASYCNGYVYCEVPANDGVLQQPPTGMCEKELEIDYRCHAIDKRRTAVAKRNQTLALDCRNGGQ